jgi:Cu+-exporting ATPase
MFKFFKTTAPVNSESVTFKVSGMHCPSCSLNIDDELEETAGVIKAETNYARGVSKIEYRPAEVTPAQLTKIINQLGYQVLDSKI